MTLGKQDLDTQVAAWLARDPDPQSHFELEELMRQGDTTKLQLAFAARLTFGTAGLRGTLGPGPAHMNRLVVRETSVGLANYLLAQVPDAAARGVVVGHDARRGSRAFAEDAAAIFAALGLRVHLFDGHMPTPVCAFAVCDLGAAAGVVVTASHNPPEYNGYKVYWENGAQIIPPHDAGIAAAIDVAARAPLPVCDIEAARATGKISSIGAALVERYLTGVESLSVHPKIPARERLVIAYTPLHGVGAEVAEAALARVGFTQVHTTPSQREPDGAFPTVRFPNPEEPGAMDAVLAVAARCEAALACANDPDADRLAVAVRCQDGSYRMLTGNEVGVLLGWDRLQNAPPDALVVTTIVSSRLLGVIAKKAGAHYGETLTGFKWIANYGLERRTHGERFVFGYEEALGYTIGGLVRDKDGISALVAFVEMAAAALARKKTVLDLLEEIYRTYGLYLTAQRTLPLPADGDAAKVGRLLRQRRPERIAGRGVTCTEDVLAGTRSLAGGTQEALGLPRADVLVYHLAGDARVIVRPSGTEPKIKCYYEVAGEVGPHEDLASAEARSRSALDELCDRHQQELAKIL